MDEIFELFDRSSWGVLLAQPTAGRALVVGFVLLLALARARAQDV